MAHLISIEIIWSCPFSYGLLTFNSFHSLNVKISDKVSVLGATYGKSMVFGMLLYKRLQISFLWRFFT